MYARITPQGSSQRSSRWQTPLHPRSPPGVTPGKEKGRGSLGPPDAPRKTICEKRVLLTAILTGNANLMSLALKRMDESVNGLLPMGGERDLQVKGQAAPPIAVCGNAVVSPLALAVRLSTSSVTQKLLEAGANADWVDNSTGFSLFHLILVPLPETVQLAAPSHALMGTQHSRPSWEDIHTPRVLPGSDHEAEWPCEVLAGHRPQLTTSSLSDIVEVLFKHVANPPSAIDKKDYTGKTPADYGKFWLTESNRELAELERIRPPPSAPEDLKYSTRWKKRQMCALAVRAACLITLMLEDQVKLRILAPLLTSYRLLDVRSLAPVPARSTITKDYRPSLASKKSFDLGEWIRQTEQHKNNPGLLRTLNFLGGEFTLT